MASGDLATSLAVPLAGHVRTQVRWRPLWMAAVGVALAALAYGWAQPPGHWWLAAWFVPGVVLAATAELRPKARFAVGSAFGVLAAYATVSWSVEAALSYFDASRWAATAFMLGVWSVLVGPWYGAVVVTYHAAIRRCAPWAWPLVGGWLWAGSEWARCALGLPWCLLAHTQAAQLPILQIADLGGAYAVTAVMATTSIALVQLLLAPRRTGVVAGAAVALAVLTAALSYGCLTLAAEARRPPTLTHTVAVVQANVTNEFRWQRAATAHALTTYAALTTNGLDGRAVDLVVWPENAVNFYLDRDPLMRLPLAGVAGGAHGVLLVGAPRSADDGSARNTAYLIDDQGTVRATYDKRRLLPFGEYRPWPFRTADDDASGYAPGTRSGVLPLGDDRFGAMICWDANFPSLSRELVREGAGFLVHLSNDAWLDEGRHVGPAQHLAAVVFRAVETRRWVARAATTGVSGFISASGALLDDIPMGAGPGAVRTMAVPVRHDEPLYVRWGDAWLLIAGLLLIVAARQPATVDSR